MSYPVFGTPIRSLAEVARMASHADASAHAAKAPDTGVSLHSVSAGNSITLSPDFTESLACFQICSCWMKKKPKKRMGATKGLYWAAYAMPVPYWRDWAKNGGGNLPPDKPDT